MGLPDIPDGSWYSNAARWAITSDIFTGDENGNFLPDDPVRRQELALLLYRCAQNDDLDTALGEETNLSVYSDASEIPYWSLDGIRWALGAGILTVEEEKLNIEQNSSRAELASAFMQYGKLKESDQSVLKGVQSVVVEGFDWGPAVTKTILSLDQAVDPASVKAEDFQVTERKESFDFATRAPEHITVQAERTVTAAYVCDEKGNPVKGASSYIALEMAYGPSAGSPYCYDLLTSKNTVCNPYELAVALTASAALSTKDGTPVSRLAVNPTADVSQAVAACLEMVDLSGTFTGKDGKTLTYGSYVPEEDGKKHPLVIWIHGAGEGGTDPSIPLLGNKVTPLYGEEFQKVMGGAYVLTPQTPTFWLQYNEEGDWQNNPGVSSVYLPTLMELIQDYVAKHDGIDENRIYVGGCSNGGYMTMDLILNYPDYFAAAYPVCEAYRDEGITDAQLEGIKDLPVWFVYASNDTTVDPKDFEAPTIERLKAIGANVHASVFPNVVDTSGLYLDEDGNAHEYMGHWSWIYFFNNECEENGVNLWFWMAEQTK